MTGQFLLHREVISILGGRMNIRGNRSAECLLCTSRYGAIQNRLTKMKRHHIGYRHSRCEWRVGKHTTVERVLFDFIIKNAEAASHAGFALAKWIPVETNPRSEVYFACVVVRSSHNGSWRRFWI